MADAEAGLSDIVNGTDESEVEETAEVKSLPGEEHLASDADVPEQDSTETKGAETKGADEKADKAKGKKKGATPAPESEDDADETAEADDHPVPRKALIEERKKRQEAQRIQAEKDRQIAELQGQLAVYSKQGNGHQQPKDATNPDEEFFALGPAGYVKKHLTAAQQAIRQEMMAAAGKQRIELGEELMRSVYKDFDEMASDFVAIAKDNPSLKAQFNAHPNPAKFAYEYAKLHREVQDIGSVDELREKIRAEEREKLEAEMRRTTAKTEAAKVSTSSAGARSAGTAPVDVGEMSLEDVLSGA